MSIESKRGRREEKRRKTRFITWKSLLHAHNNPTYIHFQTTGSQLQSTNIAANQQASSSLVCSCISLDFWNKTWTHKMTRMPKKSLSKHHFQFWSFFKQRSHPTIATTPQLQALFIQNFQWINRTNLAIALNWSFAYKSLFLFFLLSFSKPWHLLPCSWYRWKVLNEYTWIEVVWWCLDLHC
jgi:hypothetical protein